MCYALDCCGSLDVVIFLLSTDNFSSAQTAFLFPKHSAFLLRKLAHWTVYFVLAILLVRALTPSGHQMVTRGHLSLTIAIAVFCAFADEWHQWFVPSREGRLSDVAIDTVGAICGSYSSRLFSKRPE
jgi:VanZ family protein